MARPKVAFFDLSSCEGCQLQVTNIGAVLFELLGVIDLVEFREVLSERSTERYHLAFVEGSVSHPEAERRLKEIRARSDALIAYGSCATNGGVNGMKNCHSLVAAQVEVYAEHAAWFPTTSTRALHQLVTVDYMIPGCPIHPDEFIKVIKAALAGLPSPVPDHAVCVECKLNENVCLYDKGIPCLGPITRAGCHAWCVNNGNTCYGCRGMVSNPNRSGAAAVLHHYGLDAEQIVKRMTMYNAAMGPDDA